MTDPDLELRGDGGGGGGGGWRGGGGPGLDFLALLTLLPSVICSFFTQNKAPSPGPLP